ncbi:MAG TPA: VOC family protein [Longimicrobium sp.]|jgi:catechol 2,3-dioxygenase-like lactoylglutathione lyase family enzyme|uniref:VOC family protein n=1 Tax=Longimicrobium sp. TaxID=2029185 RepID=UPI002EDA6C80
MLRLNHANLPVPDVPALRDFFVRHFDFRVVGTRPSDAFVVMEGADGFRLNLIRTRAEEPGYPRDFYVGFLVDAPETVRAKHAELTAAGVAAGDVQQLARGGESSVTSYCHAGNGILVEVGCPERR